ncbi:hypothetical protein [Candidatus Nanohalobium constans]|uniref:Uncharacterized protein n=1 Tax=Candidatus Nanohalobium constans TaxID=2565781 RepID=A0A5Q0UFN1_9ARCH|nr:hypothetical protein [Candidatus Nanohalobium constans]QGA80000.1 hypothetical protein LC1Nh_0092 [Candidatus Nanohalobium constans]
MIVGFNIDSIDASKGAGSQGNIQVNYAPKIKKVTEQTVNAIDEPVAKIDFEFSVNYMTGDDKAAEIQMSGHILWKGQTDEIIESWEENGELPEEVNAPLMNEMYKKLLSEAVGVADTLNLLPPIPTPKVDQ